MIVASCMFCSWVCSKCELFGVLVVLFYVVLFFVFFKQKTAYEMRISDWISDVCFPIYTIFIRSAPMSAILVKMPPQMRSAEAPSDSPMAKPMKHGPTSADGRNARMQIMKNNSTHTSSSPTLMPDWSGIIRDRKSEVTGKSGLVRRNMGGGRTIKK